jgi:hypothetical protein
VFCSCRRRCDAWCLGCERDALQLECRAHFTMSCIAKCAIKTKQ